ncbi:amidohydrolase [Streptomyces sp. NPDC056254]|uniref:amidohydrolase n=1 Tax=Streptomyces sp. NPDC056254 TaxID=3345763 RepID=UPI0035D8D595
MLTGEPGALGRIREAIAIGRDGTVLGTGTSAEMRRFSGRDTEILDARGGTVMSGIHDGHAHVLGAGAVSLNPSLRNAELTVPQLQETLSGFLRDSADDNPDRWLTVEGWYPVGLLPDRALPHHRYLDALPTRRPIVLVGNDGHNVWVNQRALDLAGITATTPDPVGGKIARDADGQPTGVLTDDAQKLVTRLIPAPGEAELTSGCARVLAQAAASGITTFLDIVTGPSDLRRYAALAESGRLPQRIHPAIRISTELAKDPAATLAYLQDLRTQFDQIPGVRIGTAKIYLDGIADYPAQTAALIDPYLSPSGNPTTHYGDLYVSGPDFGRLATVLDDAGWQVHVHAIGDRAVRTALDGFQTARRANGPRDNRHTIAHLQMVHPDDFPRFSSLGVIACMQLQWARQETWNMESLLPYIGPERHKRIFPARSLEQHGAMLTGGSDWPTEPLQPFNQVRTAVDRLGADAPRGPLYSELESISRMSSLAMHTRGTAIQLHQEHLTGTLTEGRAADLLLLDRDVTTGPVQEISNAQVRLTLIAGRAVHDASATNAR